MEVRSQALLLALLCASGCQSETVARTEVLLVVDSDLRVPEQLDRLDVHVDGPAGLAQDSSAALGAGGSALPRSVALVHEGGPLGPLQVVVKGSLSGQLVLKREARLAFVAGKTLVLPMHLVARCVGAMCGELTCSDVGCTSIDIDPMSLLPYEGEEPSLHASDGGVDLLDGAAALDASTPEAGMRVVDAGSLDGASKPPADAAGSDAGMCVPTQETCNALDDDCDGIRDNGFDLLTDSNHCGSCATRCGGSTRRCCKGVCRGTCL